jgi:mRNA interferase MazF
MTRITMTYNQFDIVVVPFPFTDSPASKRRPAIILSSNKHFNKEAKHSIMAMITSARNTPWPCDTIISNLASAGLSKASVIRMKFFTLDHRFILETIGSLAPKDQKTLQKTIKSMFDGFL